MKNFNNIETIYRKQLKTIHLKIEQDYITDPSEDDKPKLESSDEVFEVLRALYSKLDDDQEHLVMLVLNVANEVTGFKVIASGTQTSRKKGVRSCNPAYGKIGIRTHFSLILAETMFCPGFLIVRINKCLHPGNIRRNRTTVTTG